MERYKRKAGLSEVTPEDLAKAEAGYARAMQLMGAGQLAQALEAFNEVRPAAAAAFQGQKGAGVGGGWPGPALPACAALYTLGDPAPPLCRSPSTQVRESVPLKTRVGGLATLQAAVCYDTLGNAQQAQALYKRLRGHPSGEVGRKARHLVFGFQVWAAELLWRASPGSALGWAKRWAAALDRP
jgi:hypothetical protein